jgi:hypothetical protein
LYLQTSVNHKLLYSHQLTDFETKLAYPFFYFDTHRPYFVRPVNVPILQLLKYPSSYSFHIPEIADDIKYRIPFNSPDFGLDDYIPMEGITPPFAGLSPAYYIANRGTNQPILMSPTSSRYTNILVNRALMRSSNPTTGETGAWKSVSKNRDGNSAC